jgi:hypothetical protein
VGAVHRVGHVGGNGGCRGRHAPRLTGQAAQALLQSFTGDKLQHHEIGVAVAVEVINLNCSSANFAKSGGGEASASPKIVPNAGKYTTRSPRFSV